MAFATLQEAWGVTTFNPEPAFKQPPAQKPAAPALRGFQLDAAQQQLPAGESPKQTLQNYLEQVYAKKGVRGVASVLGKRLVDELCQHKRRRAGDFGGLSTWLANPEHVLMVLVVAFVLLMLADAVKS